MDFTPPRPIMSRMNRCFALALALAGALSGVLAATPAVAHPHVFVDGRSEIVLDAEGRLVAVKHAWAFDEAFAAFAVQGLDADGDGKLTRAELDPLAKVNVESLLEFGYFTYPRLDGRLQGFKLPTDYWLDQPGGKLTLHFTLPLKEPVPVKGRSLTIDVFDPGYFVDFEFEKEKPVTLAGGPGCALDLHRKSAPDEATAAILSRIPATERDLPPSLQAITRELANRITVTCR